jgi:hypothetical protein
MSTLYSLRYAGKTGLGVAAMSIGGGLIVGFDGAEGRYHGSYDEKDGRIRGTVTLTMAGAWPMVTGESAVQGQKLEITLDLPADFGNGEPHEIMLSGHPVTITAKKIGDVP